MATFNQSKVAMVAASASAFAAGIACGIYITKRWFLAANAEEAAPAGPPSPTPSVVSMLSLPPTSHSFKRQESIDAWNTSIDNGDGAPLSMVILVRKEVAQNKQKLAVVVSSVVLALFKKCYKRREPSLASWELAKAPKLVLRADSDQQMQQVLEAAKGAQLPYHAVVEPASTNGGRVRTALALGPAGAHVLHGITSHLKLL